MPRSSRAPLAHRGNEVHLLREVVRTYQALMAGISREVGVPSSRFALMRLLAVTEESIGVMDLARLLGIDAAAVARHLKDMEKEGLVRRRADPRDRRRSYAVLSARGLRVFKALHDRSHDLERALSTRISAEEMNVAVRVLTTLRSFVENYS